MGRLPGRIIVIGEEPIIGGGTGTVFVNPMEFVFANPMELMVSNTAAIEAAIRLLKVAQVCEASLLPPTACARQAPEGDDSCTRQYPIALPLPVTEGMWS